MTKRERKYIGRKKIIRRNRRNPPYGITEYTWQIKEEFMLPVEIGYRKVESEQVIDCAWLIPTPAVKPSYKPEVFDMPVEFIDDAGKPITNKQFFDSIKKP